MKSVLLCVLVVTFQVLAANRLPLVPAKPQLSTIAPERQIGGQAGSGFSLLNVQKIQSKDGRIERLVLSIGTREGRPLKGFPGYFNAQNQTGRLTLDLAQVFYSKIDEKVLRAVLTDSKFIKNAHLIQDPLDQTLTLAMDLKSPVRMKTVQVKGQKETARILVDIIKK